ncbi:MAG: hypothetical protein E5Y88_25510 [Mesorhizobium sp.]|uniref:Antitoxin FitA-like ribbon-helix-helix domain-containing protein n=1 Tax=Mesorhizobium mediterraneum TaxID=43617 RepID=A0AB36R3F4_9HYPH|nr:MULTISPECIES: hypothetical protein [Mesorhizobium]RUU47832.1 hypothetical protein EOD08_05020 [Mesorhizobium sp. M6A.T.Ca.TU.002.02.2.1]AZO66502.1 hypothetical protein EJ075_17360 [Mesorhizobium sp. M6A.T.Cr.TU.016.01.1.1]PAP98929.1 hypothetical protein CIT25_28215 [Mesorhizobium mediterraneum]RVB76097.1 hypothetical protein EN885_17650 [Mesorhizobium sp. M6A.T.Cr.TU.014.01.1.1]RWN34814.1 MAG: hypothetical protein EOR95_13120 [Mesorhizobium sp.]
MGTLTIRNLDDSVKQALRERAAARGVSMEQEAREVLAREVKSPARRRIDVDKVLALGVKPAEPFDLKKLADEMWDEGLR